MNKFIFFLLCFSVISCVSHKKKTKIVETRLVILQSGLHLTYQLQNSEIKNLSVQLTNNSDEKITLLNPYGKHVERKVDEIWQRVNIILCPCGAQCEAAPREISLKPGEHFSVSWDLQEGYCTKNADGMPISNENFIGIGHYRWKIESGKNLQFPLIDYFLFEIAD